MNWHSLKKETVLKELKTSEQGLSNIEARKRLEKYGENILKETFKLSPIKIFLTQFNSIIVYVLLAATLISFLIKHFLDATIIFIIIILNAGIGFLQQYKAEKSILELRKILTPTSKVLRGGRLIKISSTNLVPGDILILEQGDKITADCRILESENLRTNEAILTGESMPVSKFSKPIKLKTVLAERKNILYAGTSIVSGNAKAVVIATAMNTEFGKIAGMVQKIKTEKTPMQKKLDKFAKQITFIILALVIILAIFGILEGQQKMEMFLTAIALAVSAIPEGLPAILTIGLALATNYMYKHKTLIRRLPAAETLGSVTVICSDKTGTMTEEKMKVSAIFSSNKLFNKINGNLFFKTKKISLTKNRDLFMLLKASVLCNNARFETINPNYKGVARYNIIGEPTESALVLSALDLGVSRKTLTEQEPRIKELSFTSERKMMSIIRKGERRKIIYTKGAAKKILSLCELELINTRILPLTSSRKQELVNIAEKMEAQGLRVLGFAYRNLKENYDSKKVEQSLIFLGFIGMQDLPRPEVKPAVQACISAGIKVKMITGDSALTAKSVASQVGLTGKIILGSQLEKIEDNELKNIIDNVAIFARITPQQKLRIVKILKQKSETVAITGDGINDVLALKSADIGISMGQRGTDVAREVSDMVLTDDNFASIVKAVEQGRIVYDNTENITKFLLALNFAEIFLIAFTIFARLPLPLLPIHILWLNLITDSIPALSLTTEKGIDVMKSKPRKNSSLLSGIFLYVLVASILLFGVELIMFSIGLSKNYPIERTRTLVLTIDVMFEMFFIFTARSKRKISEIGLFSNKNVWYAFFLTITLNLIIIYTPIANLVGLAPLSFIDWAIILPLSLIGVIAFEISKYFKKEI